MTNLYQPQSWSAESPQIRPPAGTKPSAYEPVGEASDPSMTVWLSTSRSEKHKREVQALDRVSVSGSVCHSFRGLSVGRHHCQPQPTPGTGSLGFTLSPQLGYREDGDIVSEMVY